MSDSPWWVQADWSLQNAVIARQFKKDRSTVCQKRTELGHPKPVNSGKRTLQSDHMKFCECWDWEQQDCELAEMYHMSRERVRQIRKLLGKPKALNHKRRRVEK